MAMKMCRECKQMISSDANSCPNCGKRSPTGMSAIVKLGVGVFGGLFALIVIGAASGGGQTRSAVAASSVPVASAASPTEPPLAVRASKLFQDYQANEVSADTSYKGRQLEVTGTVTRISKSAFGGIVIGLGSSNQFSDVHASMRNSEAARVARLSKGQQLTVSCEGQGMILGSPVLHDCALR